MGLKLNHVSKKGHGNAWLNFITTTGLNPNIYFIFRQGVIYKPSLKLKACHVENVSIWWRHHENGQRETHNVQGSYKIGYQETHKL